MNAHANFNERDDDEEVARMAVAALAAAQQRALQSGRECVLVENGMLVRKSPSGTVVIRALPPREKALVRIKRAKS
jgi:hypothetical protein